jgi:signal transduction histidine kinase
MIDRLYEKGIYPLFRFFLIIQWCLGIFGTLIHWYHDKIALPTIPLLLITGGTILLLTWLSIPWLLIKTGRFNLPVSLIFSAAFSLSVQYSIAGSDNGESSILYFFTLLVPLIITGWQYRFRHVLIYSALISAGDLVLALTTKGHDTRPIDETPRLVILRAGIYLLTGFVLTRIMKLFREQREELKEANRKQLSQSLVKEQLAITRERNRLAREIHDTLAHTLSGLAVQLQAAESLWPDSPTEAAALTTRALQTTRAGLTETRRALKAMRTEPVEELGLERALKNLVNDSADRTGLKTIFDADIKIPLLGPDREQGLYRIAQEALENIVKHAGASTCRMGWTLEGTRLTWEISDDGKGFNINSVDNENHFGLKGIRERTSMMNGEITIESSPGRGTRLVLQMDIKEDLP